MTEVANTDAPKVHPVPELSVERGDEFARIRKSPREFPTPPANAAPKKGPEFTDFKVKMVSVVGGREMFELDSTEISIRELKHHHDVLYQPVLYNTKTLQYVHGSARSSPEKAMQCVIVATYTAKETKF
jgi:hypothetical protein